MIFSSGKLGPLTRQEYLSTGTRRKFSALLIIKKKLLWSSFFKWCVCTRLCAQINLTGGFCLPDDLVASKRTQNYLSWVKSVFNDVVQTEPTTCQTSKPRENFNIKSTLLVLNTRLWDIIEVQIN